LFDSGYHLLSDDRQLTFDAINRTQLKLRQVHMKFHASQVSGRVLRLNESENEAELANQCLAPSLQQSHTSVQVYAERTSSHAEARDPLAGQL